MKLSNVLLCSFAGLFLFAKPALAKLESTPVLVQCESQSSFAQCLNHIASAAGVKISCPGCINIPSITHNQFSGSLIDVMTNLMQQANIQNYSFNFDEEHRQVNVFMQPSRDTAGISNNDTVAPQIASPPADSHALNEEPADPLDVEILPSMEAGKKGLTLREANKIVDQQEVYQYIDDEVVPPSSTEGKSVTFRGIKGIQDKDAQEQAKADPLDAEAIPPSKAGEKGTTLREVKEMQAKNPNAKSKTDPLDEEVIPPQQGAQRGITLREIQIMQNQKASDATPSDPTPGKRQ